jgi:hypothetical protein
VGAPRAAGDWEDSWGASSVESGVLPRTLVDGDLDRLVGPVSGVLEKEESSSVLSSREAYSQRNLGFGVVIPRRVGAKRGDSHVVDAERPGELPSLLYW